MISLTKMPEVLFSLFCLPFFNCRFDLHVVWSSQNFYFMLKMFANYALLNLSGMCPYCTLVLIMKSLMAQ